MVGVAVGVNVGVAVGVDARVDVGVEVGCGVGVHEGNGVCVGVGVTVGEVLDRAKVCVAIVDTDGHPSVARSVRGAISPSSRTL